MNLDMLPQLLAKNVTAIPYDVAKIIYIVLIGLMTLCALFIIIVVMCQEGNSDGMNAINGNSETFFGKNRANNLQAKLKRLTVITMIVFALLTIAFFVITLLQAA